MPGHHSWRLLAVNNRDLGRAPIPYRDPDACRAAVDWLQKHACELRVTSVRSGPSSWSWRLMAGAIPVAVCSREYYRRIQALEAAATMLELIPGATLDESHRVQGHQPPSPGPDIERPVVRR